MANLPLRNLGTLGVITDVGPHYLPPNAFTKAVNVVFDEDRVQRAPVFKQLYPAIRASLQWSAVVGSWASQTGTWETLTGSGPGNSRFVASYADPTQGEAVVVCDNDGSVRGYPGGSLVGLSPVSGLVTNEEVWTHAQVAGLSLLARKGMRPYVRNLSTGGVYSLLAGDWVATDTARVVRSYLDYVVMLGINKAGTDYPTMVKWSNPVPYSAAVTGIEWDPTNPGFVAGENVLSELSKPILDGMVLGNVFIIYTQDQVWFMEYTGDSLVFRFRRLFATGGIFNTNCVVEVDGRHYVFGDDDLYVHDGMTRQSIADKRVRRQVFGTLNRVKRSAAFVMHDPVANLVYFCYQTVDPAPAWDGTQFCNQAAIYNYRSDTWSFMDLPNAVGGAQAQYLSSVGSQRVPVILGATDTDNGLTGTRVYALDLPAARTVDIVPHPEALKPAIAERVGLDLDDPGTGLPLRAYKTVTGVVPQVTTDNPAATVTWDFGSSDIPHVAPTWRTSTVSNPTTEYKVDTKVSGRYLAYRMTCDSEENFKLTGLDAEVVSTSRR